MASFWYNKAVGKILRNTIDLDGDTFKVGLSTSTHAPNKDDAFCDDGGADDFSDGEISVTNYTGGFNGSGRKTLSNRTVTDDLTNDRVVLDADDITWTALGAGATIAQATMMKEVTNDAASSVIINLDFPDTATSGIDFQISFAATGIGYSQE